ncbi:Carboxylesterase NlhH [Anatilimnocola aggregata]|uniref:Carboxylesterase NlhH n=1 Tax=Anatilimnocola aggregata TaxID=2528021 RepID=A0A517YEG4_9BACT|nr:alpha/beta hydrolase [Anatilimnocola aggregata]QDU28635.1 Carboxylesterase NlhH [Anatilimnocola aggregata]
MFRLISLLALVAFAASEVGTAAEPTQNTYTYKKTKQAELTLQVYRPAEWEATKKYPAIVFFFGGGWNGGNIKQFEPQSQYLAKRGMVAICVDYRVKSRHGVTPDTCVRDAKSAIRWVRQNAAKLGIDPAKIVGAGGSAGGHLAACTGICPELDEADEDAAVSSRPNVLVLFNPVLNFNVAQLIERVGNDQRVAKSISPTQHLAKDSPPTLLMYGTDDKLIAQGDEYLQRSKELGHRAEMMRVDGVGHGFFNRPPHLQATIERVDAFLVALGYLKPDATEPAKK